MLMIPGGRLEFYDQGYGEVGIPPETILEEGHYDPYACCRAVLQACTTAIEHKWRESTPSTYCSLIRVDRM